MTYHNTNGHFTLPPEENYFESIVVDLTHRCNMECANCYLPNRTVPDLNVQKLYDVLRRLPKRTYIRLIGGEPTLRQDLPDIISEIITLGHKPSLTTNGLKLAQLSYCENLKRAGLRYVLISMNGAADDQVYRILDGGKYATVKTRALTNAFRCGFHINTGTIIAKGVNEHVIREQIDVATKCAKVAGVDLRIMKPWSKVPPVLRIKSVGQVGRYMEDCSYSLEDLKERLANALERPVEALSMHPVKSGLNYLDLEDDGPVRSVLTSIETDIGKFFIRLIDWSTDNNGVPDAGSRHRGRLTQDFRIAPFFEDIKINEFGY